MKLGRRSTEQDFYGHLPPPEAPTDAAPGSPAKVAVMRRRLARGQSLYHPRDAGRTPLDQIPEKPRHVARLQLPTAPGQARGDRAKLYLGTYDSAEEKAAVLQLARRALKAVLRIHGAEMLTRACALKRAIAAKVFKTARCGR